MSATMIPEEVPHQLNRRRYLQIMVFAFRVFAQVLWWYMVIQPVLGRRFVKRGETKRLIRWARQFRELAIRLGGVMIKLGQFVSSRIDVLPPEIIQELSGLQDEVPPLPFPQMEETLRTELGPDWRDIFAVFDKHSVASASFGQAYRGQLQPDGDKQGERTPQGDRVVVKVQRPNITPIVYTDLSALDVLARFAMRFKFISRRANVPLLLAEFARVLWEELDYTKEAANADRFAELFADDMGIYIPAVYYHASGTHRVLSTRAVITLEDVTAIKLDDYAALEAAGIDRKAVAQRLLEAYLTMVFVHRFFHADPHPGNIFIYPLPGTANQKRPRHQESKPFYLIFIDFGMTGELTPEIEAGLREALIGLITRDTQRLVRSFEKMDILLPGADMARIEEATDAMFDQVWGMSITEMASMDTAIMRQMARDFGDIMFSMPFQVPQDFVYFGRAIGILSGMCTGLDPAFDPWRQIQPFAQKLLLESSPGDQAPGWLRLLNLDTIRALATPETMQLAMTTGQAALTQAISLPAKADAALTRLERGDLTIQTNPTPEFKQQFRDLQRASNQLVTGLVFGGIALSSAVLYTGGEPTLGGIGFGLAGVTLVVLLVRGRT